MTIIPVQDSNLFPSKYAFYIEGEEIDKPTVIYCHRKGASLSSLFNMLGDFLSSQCNKDKFFTQL